MTRRATQAGVTLMELLIAVTLLSMLSVGMVISLRVGLSAMYKTDDRLMGNRRVVGVERILEQQVAGIMPVTADCQTSQGVPGPPIGLFQGAPASLRLASTYSLQQGARGMPMILEYQVIPGENALGVRLVVNERVYTGSRGAGVLCRGLGIDPVSGVLGPQFVPVEIGPASFVIADKLAYCRVSYRDVVSPPQAPKWLLNWSNLDELPSAVRFEMAPLNPDAARLQPITLTIPIRVTRPPLRSYGN
jgi:prepilin-type N-terminal cleavage/methylation domain-containing protein